MADTPSWYKPPTDQKTPIWYKAPEAAAEPTAKPEEPGMLQTAGRALKEAALGPAEAVTGMITGMFAKPASEVMGMSAMASDVARGRAGDAGGFQQQMQREMTYEPRTQTGQAISQYNPMALLGKGINWAGEQAQQLIAPPGSSTGRQMVGAGVGEAVRQAPGLIGGKAPVAAEAAGRALKGAEGGGASKFSARGMMQSAIKPGVEDLQSGRAGRAIDTMLDEGYNVSKGGVEKMQTRIDILNNKIKQVIENSPAVIDKHKVATRLYDTLDEFQKQVNPLSDISAIQKVWDEFLTTNLGSIPIKEAQGLKQGTGKRIASKYGELGNATTEAQKALTRGLKEEIVKAAPQVEKLNAEESKLLNTLSVVERRVLTEANKNPAGLGWLSADPAKMAGFMLDRSALFKSLVARMLNKASSDVPQLGKLAPLGGVATNQAAGQLPPPPEQAAQ